MLKSAHVPALRSDASWKWSTIGLMAAVVVMLGLISAPNRASAQYLEVGAGWAHSTGNNGLDGFNAQVAWWFKPRFVAIADWDNVYDTSHIGVFDFTSVGPIATRAHMQNYLVGGRWYLDSKRIKGYRITPFAEVEIGASHLSATVKQGITDVSGSDTGFTWTLGGGADYRLSPHWSARGRLGFLRSHLNESGQSRLRLVIGATYTFGVRE
jgi:opacity protein-like surface antigen